MGESGTGKEVVARYIHDLSHRTDGPFLSINCGALPEGLLESELFGHVKGSFTGAVRDKSGLFTAAAGGTFFLDEIGETTPATQVKLLRVLQHREVIPVGATDAIPIDTRILAATNRDLEEEIKRGNFRRDLFYRLNVIALHLPPLRQRADDIPLLAEAFLARHAEQRGEPQKHLSEAAMEILQSYQWPGNVRELENALERAVILTGRRRHRRRRAAGADGGAAQRAARVGPDGREPDDGNDRTGVHHVGARERAGQQDPRRRSARDRPVHAASQAVAVRCRDVSDGPRRPPGARWYPLAAGALVGAAALSAITVVPVGVSWEDGVYLIGAKSLATGAGYRLLHLVGSPPAVHFPPAWSAVLAVIWKLTASFPGGVVLLKLVNPLLLAAGAVLACRYGMRRLDLPPAIAAVTAVVFTAALPLVVMAGTLAPVPLFVVALFVALALADRAVDLGGWRRAAAAGVAAGAVALVHGAALALLPALVLALLVARRRGAAVAAAAGAAALLAPWQFWLARHTHDLATPFRASYGPSLGRVLELYRRARRDLRRDRGAREPAGGHAVARQLALPVRPARDPAAARDARPRGRRAGGDPCAPPRDDRAALPAVPSRARPRGAQCPRPAHLGDLAAARAAPGGRRRRVLAHRCAAPCGARGPRDERLRMRGGRIRDRGTCRRVDPRRGTPCVGHGGRGNADALLPVAAWISANTNPDDVVAVDGEPFIYLRTGRTVVPVRIPSRPTTTSRARRSCAPLRTSAP